VRHNGPWLVCACGDAVEYVDSWLARLLVGQTLDSWLARLLVGLSPDSWLARTSDSWLEVAAASERCVKWVSELEPSVYRGAGKSGRKKEHYAASNQCVNCRVSQNAVCTPRMTRVDQNHIYTPCFWQGNHQTYDHVRCIYTILAQPKSKRF
jgi:hypothetical protein